MEFIRDMAVPELHYPPLQLHRQFQVPPMMCPRERTTPLHLMTEQQSAGAMPMTFSSICWQVSCGKTGLDDRFESLYGLKAADLIAGIWQHQMHDRMQMASLRQDATAFSEQYTIVLERGTAHAHGICKLHTQAKGLRGVCAACMLGCHCCCCSMLQMNGSTAALYLVFYLIDCDLSIIINFSFFHIPAYNIAEPELSKMI